MSAIAKVSKPIRLQLSRKRGFDLQGVSRLVNDLDAMNCARPGIFGNPFVVGVYGDAEQCVEAFRRGLRAAEIKSLGTRQHFSRILRELPRLHGKNLACWCKPDAVCHVDVLLDLAAKDRARREGESGGSGI